MSVLSVQRCEPSGSEWHRALITAGWSILVADPGHSSTYKVLALFSGSSLPSRSPSCEGEPAEILLASSDLALELA